MSRDGRGMPWQRRGLQLILLASALSKGVSALPDCVLSNEPYSALSLREDLDSRCTLTLEGELSVAFTALFDRIPVPSAYVLNVRDNSSSVLAELQILFDTRNELLFILRSGSVQGSLHDHIRAADGHAHTYLLSADLQGRTRLFRDGSLVSEGNWKPVWGNASLHWTGLDEHPTHTPEQYHVRSVRVWGDKVGWLELRELEERDEERDVRQFDQLPSTTIPSRVLAAQAVPQGVYPGVTPICDIPGRVYTGASWDEDVITTCPDRFGGAFSAAFTARFDAIAGQARIFDFGSGPGENNVMVGLTPSFKLWWRVFSGTVHCHATSPVLTLNRHYRFLVTVSNGGYLQLFQDGVVVGVNPTCYAPPLVTRTMLIAGGLRPTVPNFPGKVEALWIWHSVVSWADAVFVTSTATTSTTVTAVPMTSTSTGIVAATTLTSTATKTTLTSTATKTSLTSTATLTSVPSTTFTSTSLTLTVTTVASTGMATSIMGSVTATTTHVATSAIWTTTAAETSRTSTTLGASGHELSPTPTMSVVATTAETTTAATEPTTVGTTAVAATPWLHSTTAMTTAPPANPASAMTTAASTESVAVPAVTAVPATIQTSATTLADTTGTMATAGAFTFSAATIMADPPELTTGLVLDTTAARTSTPTVGATATGRSTTRTVTVASIPAQLTTSTTNAMASSLAMLVTVSTSATTTTTTTTGQPERATTANAMSSETTLHTTALPASFATSPAAAGTSPVEDVDKSSLAGFRILLRRGDLANGSQALLEGPLGVQAVIPLDAIRSTNNLDYSSVKVPGGFKVAMPKALLEKLPGGSYLSVLKISPAPAEKLAELGGRADLNPIIDISLFLEDGTSYKGMLPAPIMFKLPWLMSGTIPQERSRDKGKPRDQRNPRRLTRRPTSSEYVCVYLESEGLSTHWSTRGVYAAPPGDIAAAGEDVDGVWCFAEHLSLFAAFSGGLYGCTNLELLSYEALLALWDNADWWSSRPASLVWILSGFLVLLLAVGAVREMRALRLGSTPKVAVKGSYCRRFMQWGPQLIKHRYAAFLVFLKDVLHCLYVGPVRLKKMTLKAAVQRCLAVRSGLSVTCIATHCWNSAGWTEPLASLPHTALCYKLHFYGGGAEKVLRNELSGGGLLAVMRRFAITLFACHPLIDAVRISGRTLTVWKCVALQCASVFGVLATNAMVLTFSGSLRPWAVEAHCPIEPASEIFLVVATMVSITVNAIPNAFMLNLAKLSDARDPFNAVFWVVMNCYMGFAGYVVLAALANLNSGDEELWSETLEWVMTIKFLIMPFLQAVRHSCMLEYFLHQDRKCPQPQKFAATVGIQAPHECPLTKMGEDICKTMAKQAISAEQLVKFAGLLGETFMQDYDPEKSTTEDVIGTIKLLGVKPQCYQHLSVRVVDAHGLHGNPVGVSPSELTCSVLHLGEQTELQRRCISQHRSVAADTALKGNSWRCPWFFDAKVDSLELNHAIGFKVSDGNEVLGEAYVTVEQVLRDNGFHGELRLHSPQVSRNRPRKSSGRFTVPSQAAAVPILSSRATMESLETLDTPSYGTSEWSNASNLRISHQSALTVQIDLPSGFVESLAVHEVHKLRVWEPIDSSVVREDTDAMQAALVRMGIDELEFDNCSMSSTGAYCDPLEDGAPADRIILHCRHGNFLHFATCVIVDALGKDDSYDYVRKQFLNHNISGLLNLLRAANSHHVRYWIELFAMDLNEGHRDLTRKAGSSVDEEVFTAMPSVIRNLKQACTTQMIWDVQSRKSFKCNLPVQIVILDRDCKLLHEATSLSEMMLARSMCIEQRMCLHKDHLTCSDLGDSLRLLIDDLDNPEFAADFPWAEPYLEDQVAVFETVRDLIVEGVKEHREDNECTWEELNMSDTVATIGGQTVRKTWTDARQDEGAADDAAMDDAGDADF